ncbi:restriction endonuclease [Micromonospora sp. NPDC049230]|uniref:restriction endonuclease n=1 Tax=Micromonospora sp. NPDC049230 TaxID=3155502 RepID=UPI0033D99944
MLIASKQRARERADQAERDMLIAVTDAMSGPEFEQWFARILVASGFRDVQVCGGPGDRGADGSESPRTGSPGRKSTPAGCSRLPPTSPSAWHSSSSRSPAPTCPLPPSTPPASGPTPGRRTGHRHELPRGRRGVDRSAGPRAGAPRQTSVAEQEAWVVNARRSSVTV